MVSTQTTAQTRRRRRRIGVHLISVLPFGCDSSRPRRRMSDVTALPASVRPPGRVGAPAFADVVAEHLDAVYRYLVYLTGDRSAAEDLAAETFEKAFRSWRRFDPRRGAPRTWLCSIARGVARGFRAETRRRRREDAYAREQPTEQFGDGLPGPVEAALRALAPGERE